MQTEISMSIAEIQSDQNVAISNRENCGWFNASCQVYKAINKLLEGVSLSWKMEPKLQIFLPRLLL